MTERGTYHDDEGVALEETRVHIGNKTNGQRTDGGRDVVLVRELQAGEVVRDPADAGNSHEKWLVYCQPGYRCGPVWKKTHEFTSPPICVEAKT